MRHHLPFASLSLCVIVLLSGCLGNALDAVHDAVTPSTPGDHGRARFAYVHLGCLLGCVVTEPVRYAGERQVAVFLRPEAVLRATTSNPEVFAIVETTNRFQCCAESEMGAMTCRARRVREACEAGEAPFVSNSVVLSARRSGTTKLSIYEGSSFVDSVTLTAEFGD